MSDSLKGAVIAACIALCMMPWTLLDIEHDLHQIAVNTTQPVKIGVAGITPEAAAALDEALRPAKTKGKK